MNILLLPELGRWLGVRFYKHATPTELISLEAEGRGTRMHLAGIAQGDATCQLRDSVLSACYERAASALHHKDSRRETDVH